MADIKLKKPIPRYIRFHRAVWANRRTNTAVPAGKAPKSWTEIFAKAYPRLRHLVLPSPSLPPAPFRTLLRQRSSRRTFGQKALTLKQISSFLYYSGGIKDDGTASRFYPSAGGRYPLEVYICPLKGPHKNTLLHYYPHDHILEAVGRAGERPLSRICGEEWSWIRQAGMLVFITAVFRRTTLKYGDKGYQFTMIEAGHLGQNMYLAAQALGLGSCALGGFDNGGADKLLDIDGIRETVTYMFSVGC